MSDELKGVEITHIEWSEFEAISADMHEILTLRADLSSARAANKAMYDRILRLEADADAQARRHVETIKALRRELAGVMQDE